MKIFLRLAGVALALLAWFDPLGLGALPRMSLFILGFDMMGIAAKFGIFALNFFVPVFGDSFGVFSWTLLLLFASELAVLLTPVAEEYRLAIKPATVFIAAFLSLGLQPALIVAGADLLINMTDKVSLRKKKYKSKKRKKTQ